MTFPKLSGFIHFSKTFPGLENAVLKFHDFSRFFMTVRTLKIIRQYCAPSLLNLTFSFLKSVLLLLLLLISVDNFKMFISMNQFQTEIP